MKKYGLIALGISLLLIGCTKPEEEEQIRTFWKNQLAQLFEGHAPQYMKRPIFGGMSEEEKAARKAAADELFSVQALSNRAMQESAVPVLLFVNPQHPACAQLIREGWAARFQEQYGKKITLTEYNVSTPEGANAMHQFLLSRELPQVAMPTLVIGETIFQNYPFEAVDPVLQPLLTALPVSKEVQTEVRPKRRSNPMGNNQYIEITMEDGADSFLKFNVKVSAEDRVKMQQAFETTQQENQKAISDIGRMFGTSTQARAFEIVSNNEQKLRKTVALSRTLEAYLTAQKRIQAEQEQQLAQLMQQSVKASHSRRRAR